MLFVFLGIYSEVLISQEENLRNQIKVLQTSAREGAVLKGINEGLEIQLQEARNNAKDQLTMLEQLKKEHL